MGKRRGAKAPVHMPTYIKEQCDLALTYAEDGGYQSAARVLFNLYGEVKQHADSLDMWLNTLGSDAT